MASYQKYIMMGVSTVLLPLVARTIQKLMGKYTGKSQDDPADDVGDRRDRADRPTDERTE